MERAEELQKTLHSYRNLIAQNLLKQEETNSETEYRVLEEEYTRLKEAFNTLWLEWVGLEMYTTEHGDLFYV